VTLRIGPHTFDRVVYDAASDVIYATVGGFESAGRERTPEDHFLLLDEAGELTGVTLMEPRARYERDGAVHLTLHTGERERVAGIEATFRVGAED
jgi:uncharacterized protein YuzE